MSAQAQVLIHFTNFKRDLIMIEKKRLSDLKWHFPLDSESFHMSHWFHSDNFISYGEFLPLPVVVDE